MVKKVSAFLFLFFLLNNIPLLLAGEYKALDLRDAKVFSLEGDVQTKSPGKEWHTASKSTVLFGEDRVGIGGESYIELYFDNRKDVVFRFLGRMEFKIKDIAEFKPYGFETRVNAGDNTTQVILYFTEEFFYRSLAKELVEIKIPYTMINVFEGIVDVDSLIDNQPQKKPALVKEGYSTYVFENLPPLPPFAGEEALEICTEECWGENKM